MNSLTMLANCSLVGEHILSSTPVLCLSKRLDSAGFDGKRLVNGGACRKICLLAGVTFAFDCLTSSGNLDFSC